MFRVDRCHIWCGGCILLLVCTAIVASQCAAAEERHSDENEAVQRPLPTFSVPDGYRVELVAGPPLVEHPLMANFDERGRLFIAEAAGLNLGTEELEEQLPNLVRMLEDTDGDGQFDRSTIFADKMTFPQGALWYDGALYVASPPNIWKLEDTDDDGVADRRTILVDRFGYTGNAASVHGCFLGPEGRIYWCDGRHGHEFRDADGALTSQGQGAYIFSCNPDGSDPRAHCGGGMDNPVEVDFTEEGEVLGTVNILYSRPRDDCLVHWLHGGVYPHSERVLGEFQRTGDLLGPVHRFGHVAVSGMMRYRSGVLDEQFRDDVFVSIFNTGKILRVELDRDGATFRAAQHDFLTCMSPDFHPTDVLEDADGSLLVIDTGGWFRKGCPTSQIAKPEIKGGIYRVVRDGMPKVTDPWGSQIDYSGLSAVALAGLLDDPRYKVRERAILECARRRGNVVASLQDVLRKGSTRQRRNAVWALARMATKPAQSAIRAALNDRSASVRQAACRSIGSTTDKRAVEPLLERLRSDEDPVRREAATALGRIGDPAAVAGLLDALSRPTDRTEEHAIIFALIEINTSSATMPGLVSSLPDVQRGALIALDQMKNDALQPADVEPLIEAADQTLALAAANVFASRPEWSGHVRKILQRTVDQHSGPKGNVLQNLAAAHLADPGVAGLLGNMLSSSTSDSTSQQFFLETLKAGNPTPLHDSWEAGLKKLLAGDDRQAAAAMEAISSITTSRFDSRLKEIAADEDRPKLLRVAALEAMSGKTQQLSDPAFRLLTSLLDRDTAAVDRLRAAQRIGAARLSRDQLRRAAPLIAAAGPLEILELIRPFHGNTDPEIGKSLLAAAQKAPGFWSLRPSDLWYTVHRCPPAVSDLAKPIVEKLQNQEDQKLERLAGLHPLLKNGDAQRGRELFRSETAKCSVCHHVGREGGKIGPDLTRIGRIRTGRDLLEAVVFPSSSFVREFQPYNVVTMDGKMHSGILSRETPQFVELQTAVGKPVTIQRDEIEEIVPSTVSIMPQGLDKTMSGQQLADLVAYLMSLK